MLEKKYEMTNQTIVMDGHTLHRIRAVRDFLNARKGEFGGWLEKESNLSQEGDCWVKQEAAAFSDAVVSENAVIERLARVYGNATVSGYAIIGERARVYDSATVCGNTCILGTSKVHSHAFIDAKVCICSNADII